jgi:hypothetical protein
MHPDRNIMRGCWPHLENGGIVHNPLVSLVPGSQEAGVGTEALAKEENYNYVTTG